MTRTHATPPGTGPADATVTVSVWHNVTRDSAGHPTGYFGFTPGDLMVKVFTYGTRVRGRHPEVIAEDAFAFNDFPRDSLASGRREQDTLKGGPRVSLGSHHRCRFSADFHAGGSAQRQVIS